MSAQPAVFAVGECMLELSRPAAAQRLGAGWQLRFGGDTFNTAYYLRKLGVPVAYVTALGVDAYSRELREQWAREQIDCSLLLTDPTRVPGLYAIATDERGERSFTYWRTQSAARQLFRLPGIDAVLSTLRAADLLYFSGITLSLYDTAEHELLLAAAGAVRERGGIVAFDPNYRPQGWPDAATARTAMERVAPVLSIALPTLEDEQRLWQHPSVAASIDWWQRAGVAEVVVKCGAAGCTVASGGQRADVPAISVRTVVDTTGAGDAFNAAYLAARLRGEAPPDAAVRGNQLAAQVIQAPGALVSTVGDCIA